MAARRIPDAIAWLAIGGVALLLRLVHLWQIHDTPVWTHLVCDGVAYDAWARDIASGQWLGTTVFYQAPLYPYFLATIYTAVGRDLAVVRIVQAALGAAGCVLLGIAGVRLFDRRTGFLAACLLALWPSAIFADSLIQKSALDAFFVCALLAALATATRSDRPVGWLAPGLVAGALALTRENALAFVPLFVGFIAIQRRLGRLAAATCFCAGVALVLTPVVVRNWVVGDGIYLTTSQLGPNFFIGNNERATGGYRPLRYGQSDPRFERRDATELAEQALGRSLTPGEVSSYWTGRALDFITREPGRWLRLLGRKAVLFVNRVELGDAEDQYTYGDWSAVLAVLTPLLTFGVLVPLAMAGIVLTWGRGAAPFLTALLGLYALTVVATFVMARYRHPVLPLLILFASAVASELPRASPRRRLVAAGLLLAIALPANWPVVAESSIRAGSLYNIGRVLQDEPDGLAKSADYYRKAVAHEPTYALAYSNLGTVLERMGQLDEARSAFTRAVELEPDRPEYVYNLGHLEAARGDAKTAAALYERVLAIDPRHADAHTNLGVLLQQHGDLDAAIGHYDAALATDPRQMTALNDRGIALAQQGKLDAAMASFRAALAIDATDRSARQNLAIALVDAGRGAEAAAELETILAREPNDAELHTRLGALLSSLGRHDDAIGHLETARRLSPDLLPAADLLSAAYAATGRPDDAVRTAEAAVAIAERTGDASAAPLRQRLVAYRDAATRRQP